MPDEILPGPQTLILPDCPIVMPACLPIARPGTFGGIPAYVADPPPAPVSLVKRIVKRVTRRKTSKK